MSQVVGRIDEDTSVSRAERDTREYGHDPVNRGWGACPCEPELTDWDNCCADADERDHCFWVWFSRLGVFGVAVD